LKPLPYREQIQSKFERNQGMIELKLTWKKNLHEKNDKMSELFNDESLLRILHHQSSKIIAHGAKIEAKWKHFQNSSTS